MGGTEGKFYWLFGGQDVEKAVVNIATTGAGRCVEMRFICIR
jgi:hypothetical protein